MLWDLAVIWDSERYCCEAEEVFNWFYEGIHVVFKRY